MRLLDPRLSLFLRTSEKENAIVRSARLPVGPTKMPVWNRLLQSRNRRKIISKGTFTETENDDEDDKDDENIWFVC